MTADSCLVAGVLRQRVEVEPVPFYRQVWGRMKIKLRRMVEAHSLVHRHSHPHRFGSMQSQNRYSRFLCSTDALSHERSADAETLRYRSHSEQAHLGPNQGG